MLSSPITYICVSTIKSLTTLIAQHDTYKRSYLFSFYINVLTKKEKRFISRFRIQDLIKKLMIKPVIVHIQYVVCQY